MALFDLAVLIFFGLIAVKALHDSLLFWEEAENMTSVRRRVTAAPAHRPAPVRPSPSIVRPAALSQAATTPIVAPVRKTDAA